VGGLDDVRRWRASLLDQRGSVVEQRALASVVETPDVSPTRPIPAKHARMTIDAPPGLDLHPGTEIELAPDWSLDGR